MGRRVPAADRLPPLLLLAWVLLQCAAMVLWIRRTDVVPPAEDSLWYQTLALEIYQILWGKLDLPGIALPRGLAGVPLALSMQANDPNLYLLAMAFSYALFGPGLAAALYTGVPFLALLLVGQYVLSRRLGDRWTGLLAALFAGMTPGLLGIARSSELYFPAAAAAPWLLFLVLATDRFRRPGASLVLGAATGLAVLLKGQVLLFVIGPAALLFALGLRDAVRAGSRALAGRVAAGGLLASAVALAVSAVWWAPNLRYLLWEVFRHAAGHRFRGEIAGLDNILPFEEAARPWTLSWALGYARVAVGELTLPLALLAAASFVLLLVRRRRALPVPVLWIAVPYMALTLLSGTHWGRYLFPAFGGVALLTALGVREIPRRAAQAGVVALFLAGFAALVLPRAMGRDLIPRAAERLLAGSRYLRPAERSPITADGAAVDAVLARHPAPGMKYIEWIVPPELADLGDHLPVVYELMRRGSDRVFLYSLPTRSNRAPLSTDEFRRRTNTWMVWDPFLPARFPDAARFRMGEAGPIAVGADGSEVPAADAWPPDWMARLAGKRCLGAAMVRLGPAMVWVFAMAPGETAARPLAAPRGAPSGPRLSEVH